MTAVYQHILVAVDESELAELALNKGIEMTKQYDATLTIAHIADTSPYRGIDMYDVDFTNKFLKRAEVLVTKYKERAESRGVDEVQTIFKEGPPKTTITRDVAPEVNADLIICGATGVSGVERIFLGGVSEHIIRHAHCDVLVTRNKHE